MHWWFFAFGLVIGAMFGIFVAGLCVAARSGDAHIDWRDYEDRDE